MANVTPGSITFAILFTAAVLLLLSVPLGYFTNPQISNTINSTQRNETNSYYSLIYTPEYNASFNNSGGFVAAAHLQQFTGLAFMFGAFYQMATSIIQGPAIIYGVLTSLVQYIPLPAVDILGLLGLFFGGISALLLWHLISNWTKWSNN